MSLSVKSVIIAIITQMAVICLKLTFDVSCPGEIKKQIFNHERSAEIRKSKENMHGSKAVGYDG